MSKRNLDSLPKRKNDDLDFDMSEFNNNDAGVDYGSKNEMGAGSISPSAQKSSPKRNQNKVVSVPSKSLSKVSKDKFSSVR